MNTDNQSSRILITPKAANKVLSLIASKADPLIKLRVSIMSGGCSGLQYSFKLDNALNADDHLIQHEVIDAMGNVNKVGIVINEPSMQLLTGATIDYKEELKGSYFFINNPNADATCSCGQSFAADKCSS